MTTTVEIKNATKQLNVAKLDTDLRAKLPAIFTGISTGGTSGLRLHFESEPTSTQINIAEDIISTHDSQVLTNDQQIEAERTAKAESLRRDNITALDVNNYADEPQLIQQLARKVALLELELQELRGG